jgi:hypothetical protein
MDAMLPEQLRRRMTHFRLLQDSHNLLPTEKRSNPQSRFALAI